MSPSLIQKQWHGFLTLNGTDQSPLEGEKCQPLEDS
uniref:Uncharacterized protein n=1 Tax=Anguilla anguilla TaxID=7936 RepID=A0A0E9W9R2_ANGAN